MKSYTPYDYNHVQEKIIGPTTMEIPNYLDNLILSKDD